MEKKKTDPVVKQRRNKTKKPGGSTGKGFKSGVSGNPKGRPRKIYHIPDLLIRIGKEKISQPELLEQVKQQFPEIKEITYQEAVLRMVYLYAIQGKGWAVEYIAERTEGKVPQLINVIDDQEDRDKFRELTSEDLYNLANAVDPKTEKTEK